MDSPSLTSYKSPFAVILIASLLLGVSFIVGKAIESRPQTIPTITVQGEGKVMAVPDIALLNFGVQTGRQKTAQEAMTVLADKMNAIIAEVETAGVDKKDMTTQNLWMSPSYDYLEGRRVETGFEANQNIQVKVRDLDNISTVLDAAVRKGANQVGSVSFTIDDLDALKTEARTQAIADAKQKAVLLASNLGTTLGEFQGYGEGGDYYPPVMMRTSAEALGMGGGADMAAPDVPAGEQEVKVTVSLTYRVK